MPDPKKPVAALAFGRGFTPEQKGVIRESLPHFEHPDSPIHFVGEDKEKGVVGDLDKPFLSGEHVVRQLNRLFGEDGWGAYHTDPPRLLMDPVVISGKWRVYATCSVVLVIKDGGFYPGTGTCDSRQGEGLGPNFDTAIRGAETAALKRAAALLGTAFGLSLRDKEDRLGLKAHRSSLTDSAAAGEAESAAPDTSTPPSSSSSEGGPAAGGEAAPGSASPPAQPETPPADTAPADPWATNSRKDVQHQIDKLANQAMSLPNAPANAPQALVKHGITGQGKLFADEATMPTETLRQAGRDITKELADLKAAQQDTPADAGW